MWSYIKTFLQGFLIVVTIVSIGCVIAYGAVTAAETYLAWLKTMMRSSYAYNVQLATIAGIVFGIVGGATSVSARLEKEGRANDKETTVI